MGLPTVSTVVNQLTPAGIRAARGYPGTLMPQLTDVAVAVNIHKSDRDHVTMVAAVCAPMTMGAYACEDVASKVAGTWRMHGAECYYGNNEFDGQSGIYIISVYGTWGEIPTGTATETE